MDVRSGGGLILATQAAVRGRPRDPDVDDRILACARRLLAERGYEGLSFETIAQETGVGRPTIYRRWPTRAHLASEIATGGDEGGFPVIIEREGLGPQIRAIVAQAAEFYGRPEVRAAMLGVFASLPAHPELHDNVHLPLEQGTRATLKAIVAKGQEMGLIRPGIDPDALFDMMVGAVMFRTFLSAVEPTVDHVDQVTRRIVASLLP